MSGGFKVFLTLSVILNVLMAGMVLGNVSHTMLTKDNSSDVSAAMSRLPEDRRALFHDKLEGAWQEMQDSRAKIAEEKKLALQVLSAPVFDEKAYYAHVQNIVDIVGRMKRHMAETIVELAKQSSPEERAILAEIISHPTDAPASPGGKASRF